jgi:F-type H+-transporting ATPase subunit alpha
MYATLFAANNGVFDVIPLNKVKAAEAALHRELKAKNAKLTETLNTGNKPSDADNETLLKVAKSVAASYKASDKKADKE